MLDFFLSPYFLLFARLCVGGVFLASAVGKMMDREGTAVNMSRYPFLPTGFGRFIAYVFPVIELAVGLMLIVGLFTRPAAFVAALLFVLFTGLVIYDLSRGSDQSCHCFGRISSEKLTPLAVVRNIALLALSALVVAGFDGWMSVDSAFNSLMGGDFGFLFASPERVGLPTFVDAVPVMLLSLFTVGIIVLGEQAVSMVRATLRGIGFQ
ncbi:MAG: MauE/DoxX family redox-associated membrane protein [Chloroflexia bacterium]